MWGLQEKQKITRRAYDEIGGVEGALAKRAESIFAALSEGGAKPEMERNFQRLFTRLVTLGEGQEDTRRVVERRELGDELWSLAQRLAGEDNRLVVTNAPAFSRETAEAVHEALIRHWPRLVGWISRDRAFQSWLRQIKSNVELWSADPADDGPLLRGGMLAQARDWLARRRDDLSAAEQSFIEASLELQRRTEEQRETTRQAEIGRQQELTEAAVKLALEQRRRARVAIAGVIILFLLAGFGGYQAYRANRSAEQALSRQLAAQSLADINVTPQRSLLLALESIRLARVAGIYRPADAAQLLHTLLEIAGGLPLVGHTGAVTAVAFSPDGSMIATGSADGTAILWDATRAESNPVVLRGHAGALTSLAFSRDGRWLATAGVDGTARLWDVRKPEKDPHILSGHQGGINALAMSPDGHWLATAGQDHTARLWDLKADDPASGSLILSAHREPVTRVVFSHTGRWLATASNADHTVGLWDMSAAHPEGSVRRLTHKNTIGEDALNALAFSPDDRQLAVAFGYVFQLWDLTAADPPATPLLQGHHDQWIHAVGFSPDGHWLATGGVDSIVKLWDLTALNPAIRPILLHGHEATILTLAFSSKGRWLGTAGLDATVRLWDLKDPTNPSIILQGHDSSVDALAFSEDGNRLATASDDGQARLWEIPETSQERIVLGGSTGAISALAFSHDKKWVATGSQDRTAILWNITDLQHPPLVLRGAAGPVDHLAASPDGHWLATASSQDPIVRLWNLAAEDPSAVHHELQAVRWITSLAFSPDGRWLAMTSREGKILLWNLAKGGLSSTADISCIEPEPAQGLAFTGDGNKLATGSYGYTARLWNLADSGRCDAHPTVIKAGPVVNDLAISKDGRWLATTSWEPENQAKLWRLTGAVRSAPSAVLQFQNRVFAVAFSPDAHWMVAASWDQTAKLLDVTDPSKPAILLEGHQGRVLSVAFSPDGRLLATLGEDHTIRLWDLTLPTAEPSILRDRMGFTEMSFSPDSRWLATGSNDGAVRLWVLEADELIHVACRTAGRDLTKSEWVHYIGSDIPWQPTCADHHMNWRSPE
jgi:WD40 repeat protein